MKKGTLTLETIKYDPVKVSNHQVNNKTDFQFFYNVPITALAIFLGVSRKNFFSLTYGCLYGKIRRKD